MNGKYQNKTMLTKLLMMMVAVFLSSVIISCGGGGGGSADAGDGGGTTSGDGTVNLKMSIANLNSEGLSGEAAISPNIYKIALVNFWLIKDDNTQINLINPDEANPTYTQDNPLIVDFSSGELTDELLAGATLEEGTYTGYKMQFLYIEMQFPVYFHLPAICVEDDLAGIFGLDPDFFTFEEMETGIDCNFRLYFNANGKFWKRDFIVNFNIEDEVFQDEWFWLRREVDDSHKNFFISASLNDHPVGGAGPDSTIDLFSDPEFWGDESAYDDNSDPIIIESGSTLGGLNASITPFTISGGEYNQTINLDVQNTLRYTDNDTLPGPEYTFHTGVLDLGPSYQEVAPAEDAQLYGDLGLHPMLPAFEMVSEKIR
jgi:hypothetical protein